MLSVAAGDGWRVEGEARDGAAPTSTPTTSRSGLCVPDGGGWFDGLDDRETWRITLPRTSASAITMDLNAGSSTLDLGARSRRCARPDHQRGRGRPSTWRGRRDVGDFQIDVNAGSLEVTLPNQSFEGSIEVNAGSVNLCAPDGAALRLNTEESIVAELRLRRPGSRQERSTWETPGFDDAAVRIELETQANAGSFSLNPEDGCGG